MNLQQRLTNELASVAFGFTCVRLIALTVTLVLGNLALGNLNLTQAQSTVPTTDSELQQLLIDLDSDQFAQRQAAMNQLWLLGPERTAQALYEIQNQGSLESRKRAETLLYRFRIGLVPGLDPTLARQILTFETGNSTQRVNCVNRLLRSGHVRTALSLLRSVDNSNQDPWVSSVFYNPDEFVQHWMRTGQWQAIDDFFHDPDIAGQHVYFSSRYFLATGQHNQIESMLQAAVEQTAESVPNRKLSVREILANPEMKPESAMKLSATLAHLQRNYDLCLQRLSGLSDSQTNLFRVAFSIGDFAQAAQLVTELQSRENRRFVLPEEDNARQLCQALLIGWAGDRDQMRKLLSEQKSSPDQLFTHACALMAAADESLMNVVVQQLRKNDKSSLFELYCDLEQWDLAFREIDYPIDGSDVERYLWVEERIKPMKTAPAEFRRSGDRTTLINLAETLEGLGKVQQAEIIFNELAALPSEDDTQDDYSQVQLCRRAISAGMYPWALQQSYKLSQTAGDATIVTIWYGGHEHAEFWYRQLANANLESILGFETQGIHSDEDFGRLIALVGRITRTPGVQTIQPSQFMNLEEIQRCAEFAESVAARGDFNQLPAIQAALHLLWDYQLYDQMLALADRFPADQLSLAYRKLLAMARWQVGERSTARRELWSIYWDNPEALECMILASLPTDFDLFQFTPDLAGADWDELELLEAVRPWTLPPAEAQRGISLSGQLGQTQADAVTDWKTVADQDIELLARLHCTLRPLNGFQRADLAQTFKQSGLERLAAWQTLEFKAQSIWSELDQQSILAANSMLSFAESASARMKKVWRAELIAKSLLTYPIGKAGLYGTFGVGVRAADLQIALENESLDKAQEIAGEILAVHPHDIEVVEQLARYFDARDQVANGNQVFQNSFTVLEGVQKKFPQSPLLANNLAWMCVQGNRKLPEAEKLAVLAMQLEPGTSNYPDTLADIFWKQGKDSEAKEMNRLSRQLAPTRSYYRRQTQKFEKAYQRQYQSTSPNG